MGRTGHIFAYEYYGIKPDLVALAKGLGSGFPISACLATENVGKFMTYDTHGSTYGGNPLAIAVASAVLDMMCEKGFLEHVNEMGKYFKAQLEQLKTLLPATIEEITGTGLMLGIKLKPQFDKRLAAKMCIDQFLLSIYAANDVLRITPSLILEKEHCDEAVEKFAKVFRALKA
jgi:acetylornithine/N-succinyldiaminopimelate aminotransferase